MLEHKAAGNPDLTSTSQTNATRKGTVRAEMQAINSIKRGIRTAYKGKRTKRKDQNHLRSDVVEQVAAAADSSPVIAPTSARAPTPASPLLSIPEAGEDSPVLESRSMNQLEDVLKAKTDEAFPPLPNATEEDECTLMDDRSDVDVERNAPAASQPVALNQDEQRPEANAEYPFPPFANTTEEADDHMPLDDYSTGVAEEPVARNVQHMSLDHDETAQYGVLEQIQAIRERAYVTFNGEDENDYTSGPLRMVVASDGVKGDCTAMLVNLDFSAKVQQALQLQIACEKAERTKHAMLRVFRNYRFEVDSQRRKRKMRRYKIEKPNKGDPELSEELNRIHEEVATLDYMYENSEREERMIDAALRSKKEAWMHVQAEANAYLYDAWMFSLLMEPESQEPDTPVEEKDIQAEFQRCQKLRHEEDIPGGYSDIDVCGSDTRLPPRAAQGAALELIKDDWEKREAMYKASPVGMYHEASRRLEKAQVKFDRKEDEREHARRSVDPSDADAVEAFDLEWLQKFQQLTRQLIEAEAAHAAAKEATREAGDTAAYDGASGFADLADDGYQGSAEGNFITEAKQQPRVDRWLQGMPEGLASPGGLASLGGGKSPGDMDLEGAAEQDEGWDVRSVGLSDSISVVARDPWVRGKIDMWESMTTALKSEAEV